MQLSEREENIQQLDSLRWLSRVPATSAVAKLLLENMRQEAFVASGVVGYRIAECCSDYAGVKQRWLIVESEARKEADLNQHRKTSEQATIKGAIRTKAVVPPGICLCC